MGKRLRLFCTMFTASVVLGELTSRLEEVKELYSSIISLCRPTLDLESGTTSTTQRIMATGVFNKHGESPLISFNYILIPSMCVQAKYCKRDGTSMFNTNAGHYFTTCVAIYSNICVECNVHGFYNML